MIEPDLPPDDYWDSYFDRIAPTPVSGLERVMEAMASRPEPLEPLVHCVITGLLPKVSCLDHLIAL